jgi:hypothetical protein
MQEHQGVLDVLFCVSARVHRKLRLAFTHMVAGGRGNVVYLQSGLDDLGVVDDCFLRFAYQLVVKPGWVLIPTFGGSFTLRGESSSSVLGCMASLAASDSSYAGDVMAFRHLSMQPGRSTVTKQVILLLKTASKTMLLRRRGGRLQAVCSDRRRRGGPGGLYKDCVVILFIFEGVFVRMM